MRYSIIFIVILILSIGTALAQTQDSDQDSKIQTDSEGEIPPQDKMISVADFGPNNVIGHLGHPLGTIVRVTGKAVDGDSTRRKANMGKILLKIFTVNGEKLNTPILFDFHRSPDTVAKPKPGENFDY